MKLIKEIKLKPGFEEKDLIAQICKKTGLKNKDVKKYEIVKMGLDARKKPNIFYVLNVVIESNAKLLNFEDYFPSHVGLDYEKLNVKMPSPVVVGFGPSGMFTALTLALMGFKPIVLEQGKCVDERLKDVENFWRNGALNEHSNIQFGEGGAGTFSDGKLNTTLNNEYCLKVINEFILNGAPKEIYYKNKAHVGTDNLINVVRNIREKIIKNGGKVIFNAKFLNFDSINAQINNVQYEDLITKEVKTIETNNLILAVGHSARPTFELLKNKKVEMRKKPFAVGVRIEHRQNLINFSQYRCLDDSLPSADYKLAVHLPSGRSVFTFCMCPGGRVVASSSEKNTIVTNGMSYFARSEENANSALLVNVTPEDFKSDDVLEGFAFQEKIEKTAFEIAGKNYFAPCETVGDFLKNNKLINGEKLIKNNEKIINYSILNNNFSKNNKKLSDEVNINDVYGTYKPGLKTCKLEDIFPQFITDSLRDAIPLFGKKIKGFDNENALLTAPETRSSCPVQIVRNENYVCTLSGLYAIGEGAGYAGGIISSAIDGIKCAEQFLKNNKNKI